MQAPIDELSPKQVHEDPGASEEDNGLQYQAVVQERVSQAQLPKVSELVGIRLENRNNGYIVAEGNIHGVRDEMEEHPMQILIRCDNPSKLAAYVFEHDHVVEARLHEDRRGLFIRTRDADRFYLLLNRVVAEGGINVESIAPVDDDLSAVYQYLIGTTGGSA